MSLHKGKMIEKAVRERRFPIKLLAERLGRSRQHIYNVFDTPDLSLDLVLKIGKIIQYDFNHEIKELASIPKEYKLHKLSEPDITYETATYWKSKYFELLEQHKLLLENKVRAYFKKH